MIFIALGANLPGPFGAPEITLEKAIQRLQASGLEIISRSNIWVTEPVPASDQPLYRNAVIGVKTDLKPAELLTLLHVIESEFGRIRHNRNEPRIIDLDLLAYDDLIIDQFDINLPHPRLQERAFVLVPLCEIAPSWIHPALNKTAQILLDNLEDRASISSMKIAA